MVGTSLRSFAHPTDPRDDDRALSPRRQNRPLDLAEADAVTVALAPATHHERVAIFKKRPFHTCSQFDRLGAVPADFEQAAALILFRPRDRAAPQEIADIHGAAA